MVGDIMIAKVVVNVSSSNVDTYYDYLVPSTMEDVIKCGTRVKVAFGNMNRPLMGYVISLCEESKHSGALKPIIDLIDFEPIITKTQLELAEYIKKDTISPLIRVLNLMVPDILLLKTAKYLKIKDYKNIDAELAMFFKTKSIVQYSPKLLPYTSKIKKAIDNNLIELFYEASVTTPTKQVIKYSLDIENYLLSLSLFKKEVQDIIHSLNGVAPLTITELSDQFDLSIYMINKMIKLNVLKKTKENVSRIKVKEIPITNRYIKANPMYDELVEKLTSQSDKPSLWAPSNVLESEIVIERILRKNVNDEKNTLIICPDILSSYKVSSFVRKKLQISVATLNSNISKGEYYDYTEEIKNNNYRVVVSSTKGAFINYPNLETVILLDSESDNYYNDQSPRYNMKNIMTKYQSLLRFNLIFQSYSPLLEDYIYGIKGFYQVIDNRKEDENLNFQTINLKKELLKGNNSIISLALLKQLKLNKENNKQSLLITNRKYFSNFIMCRSCGEIVKCTRCDMPLQYSKNKNQLMCPYCGLWSPTVDTCSKCGSETFLMNGSGMEKIVEDLNELLPEFRVVTIDQVNYQEFSEKMLKIEENEVDIIISTDVFSRSIVDKNIGLIAIVDFDEIAGTASYMANERAFNLLVHAKQKLVNNNCKMLIQTYNPENPVLVNFITGQTKKYLKEELSNRKNLKNPPFYYINRIFVKGKYEDIFKEASCIKKVLQQLLGFKAYIIGPTYNKTHQAVQIIIKHQLKNIENVYNKIYEEFQTSSVLILFDKYPRYI